jgi:predicted O-methyltransferase YrrM
MSLFEKERKIRARSFCEQFPDAAGARIVLEAGLAAVGQLGNVDIRELAMLAAVCAARKPGVLFEFGTFDGRTTLHLALNSPLSARLYTIDLRPDDPIRATTTDDTFYTGAVTVGMHFRGTAVESKITQIFENTLHYDHTALRGGVDFIFIDAGHAYDLVKSDTGKALDMVKPGGVVFWHDYGYGHPGNYRYLNELASSMPLVNLEWTQLVCFEKPA